MSTEEALVAVLIGAIAANLVLALGLIAGPRWRAGRRAGGRHEVPPFALGHPPSGAGGRPIPAGIAAAERGAMPAVTRRRAVAERDRGGDLLARLEAARGIPGAAGVGGAPAAPFDAAAAAVAATDDGTGLDTPATWSRWLVEEGARVERYGRPTTIVLVELGEWDRLAERLGRDAAERLLPPIAATMRRHARASDHLARLGRTRFGALLVETDEIRAINYVERIRVACDVWLAAGAVALRLSIGWAELAPRQSVDVAIVAAERRLNEERRRNGSSAVAESGADTDPDVAATVVTGA